MNCYIICLGRIYPEPQYTDLFNAIKVYPTWEKLTDTVWAVTSGKKYPIWVIDCTKKDNPDWWSATAWTISRYGFRFASYDYAINY